MKVSRIALIAAVAGCGAVCAADPVDVVFGVSGGSGAWVLDFHVTNNFNPADMDVYFFGVLIDTGRDIVGSPTGYDPNGVVSFNPSTSFGGSNTTYNNNWQDPSNVHLLPGETLSGFRVNYTGVDAPTEVRFFAFGLSKTGEYDGSSGDFFNTPSNPGVEGTATLIPLPSASALAGLGLLGVGLQRRRRSL